MPWDSEDSESEFTWLGKRLMALKIFPRLLVRRAQGGRV